MPSPKHGPHQHKHHKPSTKKPGTKNTKPWTSARRPPPSKASLNLCPLAATIKSHHRIPTPPSIQQPPPQSPLSTAPNLHPLLQIREIPSPQQPPKTQRIIPQSLQNHDSHHSIQIRLPPLGTEINLQKKGKTHIQHQTRTTHRRLTLPPTTTIHYRAPPTTVEASQAVRPRNRSNPRIGPVETHENTPKPRETTKPFSKAGYPNR